MQYERFSVHTVRAFILAIDMAYALFANIAFLLVLYNSGHVFAAVIGPRNEAVVIGSRMVMNCTVDSMHSFRSWTMERISDRLEKTIYQFTDARPSVTQFGILHDGTTGTYSLYANSTSAGDAGTFRCIVKSKVTSQLLKFGAQLVVIDSPPSCRTNLTTTSGERVSLTLGELFFVRCSVRYQGNLNLSTEWKKTPEHGTAVVIDVKVVTSKDVTPSNWNVIADFSTAATFSWRVFFPPPASVPHSNVHNATVAMATNAPGYEYVWNSPLVLPVVATSVVQTATTATTATTAIAKGTDLSSPVTPNKLPSALTTESAQGNLLRVVSENWVIVMLGCIVFCFLVTAGVACYCVKSRNRANEQRVQMYRQMSSCGSNNATGTAVINETYDAIDDAIVYCDISPSPTARDGEHRRPSLSSPSPGYATMMRRLPATPPAGQTASLSASQRKQPSSDRRRNQPTPAKQAEAARTKGVTIDRNVKQNAAKLSDALETIKSSSLPNLYDDFFEKSVSAPKHPPDIRGLLNSTYGNVTAVTGSTCYVTQDDVAREMESTYLDVNELSRRGKDHHQTGKTPYPEQWNDPYLMPNPV